MNLLIFFFIALVIIALLAAVVILNFYRYRFPGDQTVPLLIIFVLMLVFSTILTLLLIDPTALTANTFL